LDLGRNLDLRWTYWAERVKLGQIHVSAQLLLGGSCFCGEVELYDSSIGTLELLDPNQQDDVPIKVRMKILRNGAPDLMSVVPGDNELNDWCKKEKAERSVRRLVKEKLRNKDEDLVYDLFPFRKGLERAQDEAKGFLDKLLNKLNRRKESTLSRPGLNLTGTTFERFHGGPSEELAQSLALKLADGQDPTKFSMDPYLQLRNHYLKIGDERKATELRL